MARLQQQYQNTIVPALKDKLGLDNVMQVPRITKITVNMGVGESVGDRKILDRAMEDMTKIAGQKPVITRARRSVASFKIRDGWPGDPDDPYSDGTDPGSMSFADWVVVQATVYPGQTGITNLRITGDCIVSNGVWTHFTNTDDDQRKDRLCVTIGGNLLLCDITDPAAADTIAALSVKISSRARSTGKPRLSAMSSPSVGSDASCTAKP